MGCNNISERIKELREEKGLTQLELSKELSVKQQTIAQWESGTRDLKTGSIIALANYFNVTSDYLLGLSEYRTAQATDIGAAIGLTEEAIDALKRLKGGHQTSPGDSVLLYCLSKIIESPGLYVVLLSVDGYVWKRLKSEAYNVLILKDFIKEQNLNISLSEIDKRGVHVLNLEQKEIFKLYKRRNLRGDVDIDYEEYKLQKEILCLIKDVVDDIALDDSYYNTSDIIDYNDYYPSPYMKAVYERLKTFHEEADK